jgi:hypothetical protein
MVLIQPCSTTRALEAIHEGDLDLDLARLEPRLEANGWQPRVNAGIMLIMRKEHEATIFRNGRVLIKTLDLNAAQAVWDDLAPSLTEMSRRGH